MSDASKQIKEALKLFGLFSLEIDDGVPHESGDESSTRWHKILVEGNWEGHPQGPMAITSDTINKIVANGQRKTIDTLVDYEHGSLLKMFGGDSKASGWVKKFESRKEDDGTTSGWALIDWTKSAFSSIKNGEFKYLSPSIRWETKDRETNSDIGPSLHSIALTNTPFLHELPEVALNSSAFFSQTKKEESEKMSLKEIAKSLGLSEDATESAITDKCTALSEQAVLLQTASEMLEFDISTDAKSIKAAIAELRAKLDAQANSDANEVQQLRDRIATMEAAKRMERARAEGKITANNEQFAANLASKDPDTFDAWLAATERVIPERKVQSSSSAKTISDQSQITDEMVKERITAFSDIERATIKSLGAKPERYARLQLEQELVTSL